MMFLSNSQGELTLIIDVQSSVVRGSLVHLHVGANPSVIYTHNIPIPYKANGGSSYLITMALRGVEEIIQATRAGIQAKSNPNELPRQISSVHFVLSSPWVVSQAKTVSMTFDRDTTISRAYITGMIWEERTKMTANATDDIQVIEEKVFDVRLNGYSVASWESKHTRELGVSFVVSIAGGRMIDRFIEACESIVRHKDHVHFHSSLFLQHVAIQKIIPDSSNYALIHIHGELTDVAIIHAHSCSFFGLYPFGIRQVIRAIAQKTMTTDEVAESTLNMVCTGDIDAAHASTECAILEDMKQAWTAEFNKLLKTNPTPESVPIRVIISSRTHEDFFLSSFKLAYPQSSPEVLSIESISSHVTFEARAERLRLTGLYVMAIHRLLKS